MAIILPLLVILLVMAIDAGRIYFGWVALQNASRIGADYAASHADAWNGTPNAIDLQQRARYALLVTEDLQALGCQSGFAVPDPNFDPDGNGVDDFSDGAPARVELDCVFDLLTPLAESFLGNPFALHSRSDFVVNRTLVGGVPAPGVPPPLAGCPAGQAKVPAIVGDRNINAHGEWVGAGFGAANYAPQPTGPNRNRVVTTQSLLADGSCQPLNAAMLVTL
jgi:hypothetical protein